MQSTASLHSDTNNTCNYVYTLIMILFDFIPNICHDTERDSNEKRRENVIFHTTGVIKKCFQCVSATVNILAFQSVFFFFL